MDNLVLTMILGYTVTTLATIALTNVVAVKVHDVTSIGKERYDYTYNLPNAEKLRHAIHRGWNWLIATALVASFFTLIFAIIQFEPLLTQLGIDIQESEDLLQNLVDWALIVYFLFATLWALFLSVRCSSVLQQGFKRQPTALPNAAEASVIIANEDDNITPDNPN